MLLKKIILIFLLSVLASRAGAVGYFKGNIYEALQEAQAKDKLLMAEFYAGWNYKSKWMNAKILGDSAVSDILNRDYIVVQVDTETQLGAELAVMYKVTDYPCIVVFNPMGNPLDKIDQTMDRNDFIARLEQIEMTVNGKEGMRLRAILGASELGDIELADKLALEYLASQPPEKVITQNHWQIFLDNNITYYSSAAFEYMVVHRREFNRLIGEIEISDRIAELFTDAIIPYVIGTVDYDLLSVARLDNDIRSVDIPQRETLLQLLSLATLRHDGKISSYIELAGILMDKIPERSVITLLLSFNFVAEKGTSEEKRKAAKIIGQNGSKFSQAQANALDMIYLRLRNQEEL